MSILNHKNQSSTIESENTSINQIIQTNINTDNHHSMSYSQIKQHTNSIISKFDDMKLNDNISFLELTEEIRKINKLTKEYNGKTSQIDEIYNIYVMSKYKDILTFSLYKTVRYVIIELSDPDLVHCFIVKMNIKLIGLAYSTILCDYLISLSDIDFVNSENEEISIYISIFDLIVNYGECNLNSSDNTNDNTPLHIAVLYKQIQFVYLLISKKVFTFYTNKQGFTALDYALYLGFHENNDVKNSDENSNDKLIYQKIAEILCLSGAERKVYV